LKPLRELIRHLIVEICQKTPLIYINVGYRLGAFGFPDGTEAVAKGALNLGLKDQIAALQWIQANVEYFGGDKSKVRSSH
jgi:acetylcholinesterase